MGKRQRRSLRSIDGVRSVSSRELAGAVGADPEPRREGEREGDSAGEAAQLLGPKEHFKRDLARVRAKFAMDPPPGAPSLMAAWQSETAIEEDEAEFVDTVADCVGAGLSLQDALTCWETGDLAADDFDASAAEDEQVASVAPAIPRRPTGGHRLVMR